MLFLKRMFMILYNNSFDYLSLGKYLLVELQLNFGIELGQSLNAMMLSLTEMWK